MKLALALIVAPTNEEAICLDKCLNNLAPHVDDIFITVTGKNEAVKQVAEKYNSNISYYDWDANFGKARNFNFSQVPKDFDYVMWCDADDVFKNPEKIKATIEETPADAYLLFYLYAFDEFGEPIVVHPKTMIIKNDGCLEWNSQDFLHEDFKQNREVKSFFIHGIERVHQSNPKRFNNAKKRNIEVAKKHVKELPDDPRSYWNLANSYKALGKNKQALTQFEKFLRRSLSDDEKYIARIRMSEAHYELGNISTAIESLRYAIGFKPELPDAYNQMGAFYLAMKQYKKAVEFLKIGLEKKPQYHNIVVYNPRDYDYVPMMNLAKAYFALMLPSLAYELLKACKDIYPNDKKLSSLVDTIKVESEKFERVSEVYAKLKDETSLDTISLELSLLSEDLQAHPMLCNLRNNKFIKTESSGRDLVYYCGHTEEVWTPKTAEEKGIGGSEEAVINLSKRLVKKGWNLIVYNNCGHKELNFDGVIYRPYWMYNYRDKQDVTILWRSPILCDYEINSDKIFIDLHDVVKNGEFNEKRLSKIDKIFVKSQFHRSLYPELPESLFEIIPNGINVEEFSLEEERDPYLLINTSSPDRGLRGLVDMFAEVKKAVPQAKLKWAYGWGVFDSVHGENFKMMEWKDKLIKDMEKLGVENCGRLSHPEVNRLYQQARIFAYPSLFAEIDCISLSKAFAGGAYPISMDFAAHGDKKVLGGIFIPTDKTKDNWCMPYQTDFSVQDKEQRKQWIKAVIDKLSTEIKEDEILSSSERAKKLYNWDTIADSWNDKICQK